MAPNNQQYNSKIFLQQSNILVSEHPVVMQTILGSCVAVCLWDDINKIGGMNHFVLPFWNGEGLPTPKYGNIAIESLVDRLVSIGANRKLLKAKVFGGGNVLLRSSEFAVGRKNIELAHMMLEDYKIPIVKEDIAGKEGRNVLFFSGNGKVLLKYIKSLHDVNKK